MKNSIFQGAYFYRIWDKMDYRKQCASALQKKFNEISTQLEQDGIPYKYKTKDHLSQTMYPAEGTLRSRTGSFGNKPDQMMEYEILVHKKDYEKVRGKF